MFLIQHFAYCWTGDIAEDVQKETDEAVKKGACLILPSIKAILRLYEGSMKAHLFNISSGKTFCVHKLSKKNITMEEPQKGVKKEINILILVAEGLTH